MKRVERNRNRVSSQQSQYYQNGGDIEYLYSTLATCCTCSCVAEPGNLVGEPSVPTSASASRSPRCRWCFFDFFNRVNTQSLYSTTGTLASVSVHRRGSDNSLIRTILLGWISTEQASSLRTSPLSKLSAARHHYRRHQQVK